MVHCDPTQGMATGIHKNYNLQRRARSAHTVNFGSISKEMGSSSPPLNPIALPSKLMASEVNDI
jgi:hypothetical protein